jgi:alcohol dehydrogenase (cytochrome c)
MAAAVPTAGHDPETQSYPCERVGAAVRTGEELMNRCTTSMLAGVVMAASPAFATEVTPERLINADREPQNWLMNHRTYNGQRFSPLARITKENVKNLKLAYAVPLAGTAGNETIEATPLAEDGLLYITDSWGVLYKIDGRSGDGGRIVWRMEPHQEKQGINRGAALWGNLVISPANWPARIIATDKETGKVVWETNMSFGESQLLITAAPLAIKDRIMGLQGIEWAILRGHSGASMQVSTLRWRYSSSRSP